MKTSRQGREPSPFGQELPSFTLSNQTFGQYIIYLLTITQLMANILAMMTSAFKTPGELGQTIAKNVRMRRKARKLSMKRLSELSGVSYASMKRFESTGEISLTSLLKIAVVLDCADAFGQLFAGVEPRSIQEIIDGNL